MRTDPLPSAPVLYGSGVNVVGDASVTTAMSCPPLKLFGSNAGSKTVAETASDGAPLKVVPVRTSKTLPLPTTRGSTQCAAVSTAVADTTDPLHSDPDEELG